MPGALLTDLYELNMAASYLKRGMDAPATFSLYVRNLPAERGFLVAAGLDACLSYLESFTFDEDELAYLATIDFDQAALDAFRRLRFEGDVWAVAEGTVVYANEPILELTAPIAIAQLVESYLLNTVTLHTTMASKAARYVVAAEGRDLVDFALRRTHGIDAGMAVTRASAIAGFVATSNVEGARRLGLQPSGTMAHSYIESFDGEAEAFTAFAEDFPERPTFLVDTYDTLGGVRIAIEVIRQRGLEATSSIRIDSGDLDGLSRGARAMLDEAGLERVRIFVSGGLDEREVATLVRERAPIDAFGIGTQMGVSFDVPCLESVYKLVRYDGRPVVKLSTGKRTLPGEKQVWRGPAGDVVGLREEDLPGERLLEQVMRGGARIGDSGTIEAARGRLEREMAAVPAEALALDAPRPRVARVSQALAALADRAKTEALQRASG
ncbi:MAG: nicotinate phosphoribosyltransferase [Actinobacteria bacterium]|nr:nicotinate phosphoribosyltransferase [Actinomycetota bacterium]